MKKRISFKLFLSVLWRGICQAFAFVGKFFGYKDSNSIIKVFWRVSAACMTVILLICTFVFLYCFYDEVIKREILRNNYVCWDNNEWISGNIVYQSEDFGPNRRIYDSAKDKTILKDVDWVVVSDDNDSLAVFAYKNKRGYINRFTGEIKIPADTYTHAWVFSDGLAAVEKDGYVMFVDHYGKVVIDKGYRYDHRNLVYKFDEGLCVMGNQNDINKKGLIDKNGDWALQPEFNDISKYDSIWIANGENESQIMSSDMKLIKTFKKSYLHAAYGMLYATNADHTVDEYDLEGHLVDKLYVSSVEQLTYETDQKVKETLKENENGEQVVVSVSEDNVPANAKCLAYEGESYWYGLMDRNGKIITLPIYSSIEAIGYDLYLCKRGNYSGEVLNGKGERVR